MSYCNHEDAPCCGCAAEMRGDQAAREDNDPYPEDGLERYYAGEWVDSDWRL